MNELRRHGCGLGPGTLLTSNAHAEQIGRLQKETADYHEMINAVKSYLYEETKRRPMVLVTLSKA